MGIAQGIAFLHFYDLVHYILRLNAFRIGQQRKKDYKLFGDEPLESLTDPSFKFMLFTAYSSSAAPAASVFLYAEKWSKEYKFNNFEHIQRIGHNPTNHYTSAYFKEKIPADARKFLIAGSKNFVKEVKQALLGAGFKPEIITEL